jgi:bacteriorhodopsin
VRYIQWAINGPLLLLGLLLVKRATIANILTTLFMALVLVVTGLVGALVVSQYKWGYFVMGVAALFYIWYVARALHGHALLTITSSDISGTVSLSTDSTYLSEEASVPSKI